MKKIKNGYILPSAAYTITRAKIRHCVESNKAPEAGDLVYGRIAYIGQHSSLENKEGRIHVVNAGTCAVFVLGNRYAPDYYEGLVPETLDHQLDLLARSGIVGAVKCKNSRIKDPTRVKIEGYVADASGKIVNTRDYPCVVPKLTAKKPSRAKVILSIGTSMNSGKSMAAAACCWALSNLGRTVRGSKITGTAGLKDILLMEDSGASPVADFSFLGYPSTYMLELPELLHIFNTLDLKYANSPRNYWVVEIADGLLQRETAILLESDDVRSRIHKLVFSAHDAFAAIGGLDILKKRFGLIPDAVSGVCSSSPLGIRELKDYTDIPIFNSIQRDLSQLTSVLLEGS